VSVWPDLDADWRRVGRRERVGLTLTLLEKAASTRAERLAIINTETRTTIAMIFFNEPDEHDAWRRIEAFADAW
jgi:hypothetical protein